MIDFSFTKEIEDRLLAPPPVGMVAVEKVVLASLRALLAGLVLAALGSPGARLDPVAARRPPCSRPPWCSAAWRVCLGMIEAQPCR